MSSKKWNETTEKSLLLEMLEVAGIPVRKEVKECMGEGFSESSCRFIQGLLNAFFTLFLSFRCCVVSFRTTACSRTSANVRAGSITRS